ncbi:ARM repeat superfamily protein [Zea mays]|uniref:ARM repeat superfamily protein n=1 Tax=Zea mays TaxID=4577 RepID=A0A1D6MP02_MAIZE|nr:ARM repeat superfamily protein [Zea mays]ONM30789.1 ARM repeat superfamily protein [Zea mays]ONM30799.1 ARM repeat superfamily protein [Zea mays]ONM30808.1 ARM repeat superfamily protein [Zea mays]
MVFHLASVVSAYFGRQSKLAGSLCGWVDSPVVKAALSLSPGVIMGRFYVVIPSSNDVEASLTDESSDGNTQS